MMFKGRPSEIGCPGYDASGGAIRNRLSGLGELHAHFLDDVSVLVLVESSEELWRDVGVGLRLELEPLGESHEDLDGVDDVGLFVEPLDGSCEFSEFVGHSCHEFVVVGPEHFVEEVVDGLQYLVDELWPCDVPGSALLFPVPLCCPFGDCGLCECELLSDSFLL